MTALPLKHGVMMVHAVGSAPGFFTGGCRWFVASTVDTPILPLDMANTLAAFQNATSGPLKGLTPMQSASFTWSTITVSDLGGDAGQLIGACSITGAVSGTALPPQCAVALSWGITGRWRGGKPRTYIPGIPHTAQTADPGAALAPTYVTSANAAAAAFQLAVNSIAVTGGLAELGVVSYYNKTANPTPPHLRSTPMWFPYTGHRVHARLDSQRRRSGKESAFA